MTNVWTQDDFTEFKRQCRLIDEAYGHELPYESVQRIAANIVNQQKQVTI